MNEVSASTTSDPMRPRLPDVEPFFETPEGELFFRNLLFATPAILVMIPLGMKALLTAMGFVDGPSRVFDTIPIIASYMLPYVGWLFALAIRPVLRNMTMPIPSAARGMLFAFLLIHIGVLTSTVLAWIR